MGKNKDHRSIDIIEKAMEKPSLFQDEKPLSLEFIPSRLPHREEEFFSLAQIFRSVLRTPSSTSQRVLITGDVGTGKTVLSQRFGMDIESKAKDERANIKYLHINCREHRGSFFMILNRIITEFISSFPQRGFSTEELTQTLLSLLDDKDVHLILALDEFEALINPREVDTLYSLTRIQEGRLNAPVRLSLICILRDLSLLNRLDKSTLSILQQNVIKLENYASDQLKTILQDRANLAFKESAIIQETMDLIADLASITGDARYAIELLWKSGKCADLEGDNNVAPKHVRKAAETMYSPIRKEYLDPLVIHEKLILIAISRFLERNETAYATMGKVEKMYEVVCEEYSEKPRAHTQFWTYIKNLSSYGILLTKISSKGLRGKTTLIGLTSPSPSLIEKQLKSSLKESSKKN